MRDAPATKLSIIAGLDPAIHLLAKKMDPRVKPAGDGGRALKLVLSIACVLTFALPAAADKLDDIRARGRLLVGTSDTSPPFSSREDGKVVGYDVDLAGEVTKRLGLPMATVSILNSERIPALQQDRVDLVASGITRAENRRKDVGFSVAYLVSPHKVLIRKDRGVRTVAQLAGRELALVKGASVDAELKAAVPNLQIVYFQSYDACFEALRDREVDGFLADEVLLASFAQKSGAAQDFTFVPDYELPRTAGFAIKKDEPRFTQLVDRVLLDLEQSGQAQKIFDAWFAPAKRTFRIQPD
jgi:polar amino acid transport system substrate-binding protein